MSQDSNDGEIGSDAGGGASHLGRGSSQGKRLSLPSIRRRRGCLCTDRAALQDEASLYGGGQRSSFTVLAQRCERAGEVLEERYPTAKTPLDIQKEKQALSRAGQVARKKEARSNGARMIFRTKLDGRATRNTAGSRRGTWDYLTNVSRLGAAWGASVEGLKPSEKDRCSCAYKAPRRSPLCWSIFSLASSSRAFLRFSFAIYSFPRVDKRPDFDGFHMLSTDRPQLSPRIYR
jgi:hypothetical protein